MSQHAETYNAASAHYDDFRGPTGSDVILGLILARVKKPPEDIRILDVGAGTGSYALAALEKAMGHVTLVDVSSGMMAKAQEKMKAYGSDRVEFKVEAVPPLIFQDNSFDAVMLNQVLHYMDLASGQPGFTVAHALLAEVKRVLKPGGCVIVTLIDRDQLRGLWFMSLLHDVIERALPLIPTRLEIQQWLVESGFESCTAISYLGQDFYQNYLIAEGPLDPAWRCSLKAFYDMATPEELEASLTWAKEMKKAGVLEAFMKEHDQTTRLGSFYILAATNK